MDKVTGQCPQTTTFTKRKESRSGIEPRSFRLPALPLSQTGSIDDGVEEEIVGVFGGLVHGVGGGRGGQAQVGVGGGGSRVRPTFVSPCGFGWLSCL